jgi:hypothetical protein
LDIKEMPQTLQIKYNGTELKPPSGKRQDPFAIGSAEEAVPKPSTITMASETVASQAVTVKEEGTSVESEESTTLISSVATTEQT